jgi:hypothetical protein
MQQMCVCVTLVIGLAKENRQQFIKTDAFVETHACRLNKTGNEFDGCKTSPPENCLTSNFVTYSSGVSST